MKMRLIDKATIKELRRQLRLERAANARLQRRLDAWPRRALEHALKARLSERKRCMNIIERTPWKVTS